MTEETKEKIYDTTKIAKLIREQLKRDFPKCVFSVTSKYFSGGSSITVAVMESDIRIKKTFAEIPEVAIDRSVDRNYTIEQIKALQNEDYHQLNEHTLREEFNQNHWCNGVFLTEEGHNFLQKIVKIADQYNWDNSDLQTDYFDVNFWFHLHLGKWDKPFKDGTIKVVI